MILEYEGLRFEQFVLESEQFLLKPEEAILQSEEGVSPFFSDKICFLRLDDSMTQLHNLIMTQLYNVTMTQ